MEDGVFHRVALFTRGSLAGTPLHRFALLSSGLRLQRSFIGVHGSRVVLMEEGGGDVYVLVSDVHGRV